MNVAPELMRPQREPRAADRVAARPAAGVAVAIVATRDVGGFAGCGLVLVNPWQV